MTARRRTLVLAPVALLALALAACGGGGGGGDGGPVDPGPGGDPTEAPAILQTTPAAETQGVPVTTAVRIRFAVPLDPTSVAADSIRLASSQGPISGSTRLAAADALEFLPDGDLDRGSAHLATLAPGVRDLEGNERQGAFTFGFDTAFAEPRLAVPHEQEVEDMRLYGLGLDSKGDGMSLLFKHEGPELGPWFRRIRDGVPTGPAERLAPIAAFLIGTRSFDVREGGDAQYVWVHNVGSRPSAFVRQYDAGADSWGTLVELTPGPGLEATMFEAELGEAGGILAWAERAPGTTDEVVRVARYDDATGLRDTRRLGPATDRKAALRLAVAGGHGVAAFTAKVEGRYTPYAARLGATGPFSDAQPLDPGFGAQIRDVAASASGHLFVLFLRLDPDDPEVGQFRLAIAAPGQAFGASIPLHPNAERHGAGAVVVGANGVATVVYAIATGTPGTFARRYFPHGAKQGPVEISGIDLPVAGSIVFESLALVADPGGNALAVAAIATGQNTQTVRAARMPVGAPWQTGLVLAEEEGRPTTRVVRVAFEPSGSALAAWLTHVKGATPLTYLARMRRFHANGDLGPTVSYGQDPGNVLPTLELATVPDGRGLLLFDRQKSGPNEEDDVLQVEIR